MGDIEMPLRRRVGEIHGFGGPREKALSAQRDEAQGQLDRITAVAKPLNQNAMGALMPLVANSNHKYNTAFAKLSDEDRSTHLPAVHEHCKSINAAKPSAAATINVACR